MRKLSVLAILALAGTTAAARDSKIPWMKFDEALARSATNGQPIAVFVAVNPNGSG